MEAQPSLEEVLVIPTLRVSRHPLVAAKLTLLRDAARSPEVFRILADQITTLLMYEATVDLALGPFDVQTPLEVCHGFKLSQQVGLVPVLRSGMEMVGSALAHIPQAQVWVLGMYRDEQNLRPVHYYNKLPPQPTSDVYFVLDPMLATGGSASDAIAEVKKYGKPVKYIGFIAAPAGVQRVYSDHPDVPIHVAAVDNRLNEHGYIVPGLGDAGDRYFNTL